MSATNVQFSVALHLMTALGFHQGQEVSSSALASSVNTNASFVRKSLSKLVKGGLVTATRGKNGAYVLARSPDHISLLDIYRVSDAPEAFAIHGYAVESKCPISSNIKPCTAEVLHEAQSHFEEALAKKTLAMVVSGIRKRAA